MAETHLIGNILNDVEDEKKGGLRKLNLKKPESKLLLLDRKAELAKFRSSSAPPEQLSEVEPTTPLNNERELFRADPAYYQFYYSQRLLNPRLPPPIVTDWNGAGDLAQEDNYQQQHQHHHHHHHQQQQPQYQQQQHDQYLKSNAGWSSPDSKGKRTSVVDRIQEDFPRTPSPVYRDSSKRQTPGNAFLFGQEDNSYDASSYSSPPQYQPQQQSLTPMFFPSSDDALLSQQMNNLNINDKKAQSHKKPQGYYGGPQAQQQQFGNRQQHHQPQQPHGFPHQQVQPMPQAMGAPYFYPPQQMPYQQNMAYPPHPQFANGTPLMSPNQFPSMAARGNVAQQTNQYNQPYYGSPQQPQQSGAWNSQVSQPPVQDNRGFKSAAPSNGNANINNNRSSAGRNNAKQAKGAAEPPADFNQPRSKLMEEFKSGRGRKFELKDIVGSVVEFSKDQHGSRFIQQKLETASAEEKDLIFKEVGPQALKLMTDVFGNYVIQKFFEFGLPSHKKSMARSLKGHVLSMTLQTYGCRVIQKALEVIEDEDKRALSSELDGHVMKCIQDQNGNHVIQKCIEKIPADMCQFIVDAFQGNIVSQAVHAYGCRVIQRILEHCNEKQTQQVLDEILINVNKLVRDQYGNYVVQHVLEHGIEKHKIAIINSLRGSILLLSNNKYASNVIEKCFQYGSKKERTEMIEEIIGKGSGKDVTQSPLFEMMKDRYANYVIQKVVEMADDNQRKMMYDVMRPHAPAIRKLTFGKHIIAVVEKYYPGGFN